MKSNITLLTGLGVFVIGFAGSVLAYEGATKAVASIAQAHRGPAQFSPIIVSRADEMAPSKPVVELMQRMPKPTLSGQRLRGETPGPSTATKLVVRF